ncbi:MAG: aminoglycoside phosphotransferase [Gammaproteobacteria bacterium]|nr:aminoglycoside phosphotransferase [Gammaproteobacteria bacterium]
MAPTNIAHSIPNPQSGQIVIDELLTASAFPHPVAQVTKRETHISWVVLTGQYAYKIKKPVRLDFIDATLLATRRMLCEQEVSLNRRLAPDLYVGVVDITRSAAGLAIGGSGDAVEYAVKMQEFHESEELCSLLDRGDVSRPEIADLAERIAEFHRSAATAGPTGEFEFTDHLRNAVLGNLGRLLCHLKTVEGLPQLGQLIDWTHDELHHLMPELRLRERLGFIRDCHGDLHARNIVRWEGRLMPFDCSDSDPKLRWIDAMNDVAFLVMDLVSHERSDLAYAFLNRYLEVTGDYDGLRLLPFYAIYRALVRAMVDCVAAENSRQPQASMHDRMCRRVNTAARFMKRPAPTLFIMHGPSGSGKSWLSERLAESLEAVWIRSDVERKRLAGLQTRPGAASAAQQGMYGPEFARHTYARLLDCAESALAGGIDIIVDAAFLRATDRKPFEELAERHRVRYVIVSCEADGRILGERVQDPLDAEEHAHAVRVHTDSPGAAADAVRTIRRDCGAAAIA